MKIIRIILMGLILKIGMTSCSPSIEEKTFSSESYKDDLIQLLENQELDSIQVVELKLFITERLQDGDSLNGKSYRQLIMHLSNRNQLDE